ncbi:hypothetical protein, partial [Pseudomonas syringae group genomosp. 7]|uniref:hypothetical protein n=1 Tax=Pseudomonas syringae group genomosp. 7 TaxID=251699 RepID=UPI00377035D6
MWGWVGWWWVCCCWVLWGFLLWVFGVWLGCVVVLLLGWVVLWVGVFVVFLVFVVLFVGVDLVGLFVVVLRVVGGLCVAFGVMGEGVVVVVGGVLGGGLGLWVWVWSVCCLLFGCCVCWLCVVLVGVVVGGGVVLFARGADGLVGFGFVLVVTWEA